MSVVVDASALLAFLQALADRFALALAARLSAPAWTADTAWGDDWPVRQIR